MPRNRFADIPFGDEPLDGTAGGVDDPMVSYRCGPSPNPTRMRTVASRRSIAPLSSSLLRRQSLAEHTRRRAHIQADLDEIFRFRQAREQEKYVSRRSVSVVLLVLVEPSFSRWQTSFPRARRWEQIEADDRAARDREAATTHARLRDATALPTPHELSAPSHAVLIRVEEELRALGWTSQRAIAAARAVSLPRSTKNRVQQSLPPRKPPPASVTLQAPPVSGSDASAEWGAVVLLGSLWAAVASIPAESTRAAVADACRREYKRLCLCWHPDRPSGRARLGAMQSANAVWSSIKPLLR